MKSFLQFTEDIELMVRVPKNWTLSPSPTTLDRFVDHYRKLYREPRRIGTFDDYEVYETEEISMPDEKRFLIVQRSTGVVAGLIDAELYRYNRLQAMKTELQSSFQGKGSNIIIKTYKLIAQNYNLQSSTLQSAGGASLWKRLIADPELRGRLYLRDREGRMEPLKVGAKEEDIWGITQLDKNSPKLSAKSMPKYSRETARNRARLERIYGLTIVIKQG